MVREGLLLPQILGELPDVLKTLDDENVKNAGQHDINFEASSIDTVIFFFRRQKNEWCPLSIAEPTQTVKSTLWKHIRQLSLP